jgi:hypothetical protein
MEEVVTATGAGSRKVSALSAGPSAATGHNNEYQQQPSMSPRVPGSVTVEVHKFKRDSSPKQSSPLPTAGMPLPDQDSQYSTEVGVMPDVRTTLSKQSNPTSSCSRSMQMNRQLVLENSISVEEYSDGGRDSPADTSGSQFARFSSVTGVSSSQKGGSELLGEFQRQPRLAGRRRTQCRRGSIARLRKQGLALVVCGELEKAAMAAQSSQAVMQVMLNLLVLQQAP